MTEASFVQLVTQTLIKASHPLTVAEIRAAVSDGLGDCNLGRARIYKTVLGGSF